MNYKIDTQASNPHFSWDSADLVGEWKAFIQHAEFMFRGPLRGKNEEEKCFCLKLWIDEKERKVFSTWNVTDAEQKVDQNTMVGSRRTYKQS